MDAERVIKSTQEQAVASWINYLNQIRLDHLIEALNANNTNLENAAKCLRDTWETIRKEIIENGKGRGGLHGMHGFIAEIAETGAENAKSLFDGDTPVCHWVNDNGPHDLLRNGVYIQQKFYQSHLSLQAITKHLTAYPDYVQNGGVYQIPADQYEKIKQLLSITEEQANKMPTQTGDFSLSLWKEVHAFFDEGTVPLERIEPSEFNYSDVQRSEIYNQLQRREYEFKEQTQEKNDAAYRDSGPSLKEGAKAAAAAAAIEGLTSLCTAIVRKRRTGKKIKDFNANDWKEISIDSGKGTAKGAVRGVSIYVLTNYTATSAASANAVVTASFGIAQQAHLLRKGKLSKVEFVENSEMLCLDAAVSALSSFVGQAVIPIPILGAIIGNAVGTMMYQISKDHLSAYEQRIIAEYVDDITRLDEQLAADYQNVVLAVNKELTRYIELLNQAFVPDASSAFEGSINLAKAMGVAPEEILDSREKVRAFFLS